MNIFRTLLDCFISGPPGDIDDAAYRRYHRDSLIPSIDTIANFRLKDWELQALVYIVGKGTVYSYQPASVEADDGDSYIHDLNGRVYKKEGFDGLAVPGTPGKTGGAFSFEFDGSSQTMEDVADGTFRLNNATPEDATALAISAALADATDVSALIAARLGGTSAVKARLAITTGTDRLEFDATAVTDNGDWLQITLANGSIAGSLSDEDACELLFEPTGDKGAAYYSNSLSMVVATGDVAEGGWYLPSWLRGNVNVTHVHADTLTSSGEAGSFVLRLKSDADTTVYGPVTVDYGTPLNATVDLDFTSGGAIIAEVSAVDDIQALEVQLDGEYA